MSPQPDKIALFEYGRLKWRGYGSLGIGVERIGCFVPKACIFVNEWINVRNRYTASNRDMEMGHTTDVQQIRNSSFLSNSCVTDSPFFRSVKKMNQRRSYSIQNTIRRPCESICISIWHGK